METTWKIDFGMNYSSIINSMCNQEELDKLSYSNIKCIKYYYGQIEVTITDGDCYTIVEDLYKLFGCPMKLSIEGEDGLDILGSVSWCPNQSRYLGDPDDSDSEQSSEQSEPEFPTERSNVDYYSIEPDDTPETKRIKRILKELEENEPSYTEQEWYEIVDKLDDSDWNKVVGEFNNN
jgi:hypothetical protein